MKSIIVAIFILLAYCLSLAQQPLHFDFEKTSVEGLARPWGWSLWQVAPETTLSMDSTEVQEGRYSLRLSNEKEGVQSVAYWFSPYELRGKSLSLDGWVKTKKKGGGAHAVLWAIADTGWVKIAESAEFQGIGDWQKISLTGRHDGEAHSWYLALEASGNGQAWFDGFRLRVEGEEKTSLEVAPDFTPEQRLWLKKYMTPFATLQPAQHGEQPDFSDLRFFKEAVGDAQIIALGEATHGTSEFFLLKHRLLQFAVQELGVRVFAIEANQLEVEKINRYVCGGEGKAEEVIRVMFRVWNTREMLALIEWMRSHNLAHPDQKVEFVGFDLQDPSLPMDSLSQFIGEWQPELRPLVDSLQMDYRNAWKAQYYPQAEDKLRQVWKENAGRVLSLVLARKAAWMMKASSPSAKNRVEWALQNARVVNQAADIAFFQKVSGRDTFMAENIRWIQQMRGGNARIIVWAHDSHIARSDHPDDRFNYHSGDSMGKYLSLLYGKDYKAFGLFTAGGQYSATVSFTNHKIVAVDAMPAPRGSFDEALHQLAKSSSTGQLFLDLRPVLALKYNDWLTQPRPVRFVGYATNDYDFGAVMSVPYQFDGVFFVDETRASRMLR